MKKCKRGAFYIASMGKEDLPAVLAVENLSFPSPWSGTLFLNELENPNSRIHLVQERREDCFTTAGHICFWLVTDEIHILNLAIHPSYRRNGLAQSLLIHTLTYSLKRKIEKAILEVREYNQPARSLYEKLGFQQIGIRLNYYQDTGENALVLERDLTSITPEMLGEAGCGWDFFFLPCPSRA